MSNNDGNTHKSQVKDDLEAFADKLDKARASQAEPVNEQTSAMAVGMKYATEFSAATLVGAALGYGFDHFFKTSPWGLLVGLFLGLVTGVREIIRSAKQEMEANASQGDSDAE